MSSEVKTGAAARKPSPSPVEICSNHTGKMEGICSISTAVTTNEFCQRKQKVEGSICSHCYAEAMMEQYSALEEKLKRNTAVLTSRVLDMEELPDTTGCDIFRFESFGDLNNKVQLENYLNIVKKNPSTRFTLWTKQYQMVFEFFAARPEMEVPKNFTLILSSLMINKRISLDKMKSLGKFERGQLKCFTVYDFEYIREHFEEMDINCGSKYCMGCRLCYDRTEVEDISEVLKADQPRVEAFLKTHDPERIAKELELLEWIGDEDDE